MGSSVASAASVVLLATLVMTSAGCGDQSDEPLDVDIARSALSFTGRRVYDAGTQCAVSGVTMHCCPSGYAMIGAHVANNVFKCAELSSTSSGKFIDVATQRNGMHACPRGSVMVGLHAARNYLTCQYPSPRVVSEYVDGNPPTQDAYPMHVCQGAYAMSGIHIATNRFNCGR